MGRRRFAWVPPHLARSSDKRGGKRPSPRGDGGFGRSRSCIAWLAWLARMCFGGGANFGARLCLRNHDARRGLRRSARTPGCPRGGRVPGQHRVAVGSGWRLIDHEHWRDFLSSPIHLKRDGQCADVGLFLECKVHKGHGGLASQSLRWRSLNGPRWGGRQQQQCHP